VPLCSPPGLALCVPPLQDWDYPDMARIAATRAMVDAGITYDQVEQVCVARWLSHPMCISACGSPASFSPPAPLLVAPPAAWDTSTVTRRAASARCTSWA
jgi:hypothetical protein